MSNNQPVHICNVLLIDNQILFREGLVSMLKNEPDIKTVGEAGTAREGLEKAIELKPDLILTEINLPDKDGFKLTKEILYHLPKTKIIIVTIYDSPDLVITALLSGARGYLAKNTQITTVLASLRAVIRGELGISRIYIPRMLDELLRLERSNSIHSIEERNIISSSLTQREIDVLQLLATDKSNRDIAKLLFITENTVKVHVSRILEKLNYKTRTEAGEFARRYGFNYPQIEINQDFLLSNTPKL